VWIPWSSSPSAPDAYREDLADQPGEEARTPASNCRSSGGLDRPGEKAAPGDHLLTQSIQGQSNSYAVDSAWLFFYFHMDLMVIKKINDDLPRFTIQKF
jgi:hypothetical protein